MNRRQKTEDRRQKTEDRRQKTEDRRKNKKIRKEQQATGRYQDLRKRLIKKPIFLKAINDADEN